MKYLLLYLIPLIGFAECVNEKLLLGQTILNLEKKENIYVEIKGRYIPIRKIEKLNPRLKYPVQFLDEQKYFLNYNGKYLNYYGLDRFRLFLKKLDSSVERAGYHIQKIGESVKARDLFVIKPKVLDVNKKTILMLVRHHGDEGTANWIFEGFIDSYLKNKDLLKDSQIIVYPMINPDGVAQKTRYNANGRDLNRTWTNTLDEVETISTHLNNLISYMDIDFLLDMHSHKSKDIIYRVDEKYFSRDYFNLQAGFIETLGRFDSWQNGNFIISNGKEGMSRIFFAGDFGVNSLTHETLKNIPRDSTRTILSLKNQGRALNHALTGYLD